MSNSNQNNQNQTLLNLVIYDAESLELARLMKADYLKSLTVLDDLMSSMDNDKSNTDTLLDKFNMLERKQSIYAKLIYLNSIITEYLNNQ